MRIKQEDFDKLPQQDRIELLLRKNNIDQRYGLGNFTSYVNQMLLVMGFLILVTLGLYQINIGSAISLLVIIPKIVSIIILGGVLTFMIDIYSLLTNSRETKKLNEKFFTFKTEVKNVKAKRN